MSLDCYASPLNCNIILVNEVLFRLAVQSHWHPSPLKETDLLFFAARVEGEDKLERKQDSFCALPFFPGT